MIMVWERYCYASPKPEFFLFSLFIFSFISQLIWVCLGWNFHRWFSIHKQENWCIIDLFSLQFCRSQHSYPVPLSNWVFFTHIPIYTDTALSLVKKFVQSALEFMKKILVCGAEGVCEISHEFQQYWDEVTELWFLAMQSEYQPTQVLCLINICYIYRSYDNGRVNWLKGGGGACARFTWVPVVLGWGHWTSVPGLAIWLSTHLQNSMNP